MSTNDEQANAQSVNSTERPTPETDELEIIMDRADTPPLVKLTPYAHLCRRLERDLAAANEQLAAERALADRLADDLNDLWHHYSLTSTGYNVVENGIAAHRAARGKEQA